MFQKLVDLAAGVTPAGLAELLAEAVWLMPAGSLPLGVRLADWAPVAERPASSDRLPPGGVARWFPFGGGRFPSEEW